MFLEAGTRPFDLLPGVAAGDRIGDKLDFHG
jgi:hypothetical protein